MRRVLPLVLVVFSFGVVSTAQRFDLGKDRLPISNLDGPWRFHTGDNPAWADPAFDDSQWPLLRPDQPWGAAGQKLAGGFGWYRFQVYIPADVREPALYLPSFVYSVEVFADGHPIGQVGTFPPHQQIVLAPYLVCPLPNSNSGRNIHIAIRAWRWGRDDATVMPGRNIRIGERQYIDSWARLAVLERFWVHTSTFGLILIEGLIGAGGLALFLLRRREREYLWFGLFGLMTAVSTAFYTSVSFYHFSYPGRVILEIVLYSGANWIFVLFIETLLKQKRSNLFLLARAGIVVTAISDSLSAAVAVFHSGQVPLYIHDRPAFLMAIGNVLYAFGILFPLYRAARSKLPDVRILFVAFAVYLCTGFVFSALLTLWAMDRTVHMAWFYRFTEWPFPMGARELSIFLTNLAMLGILVLRFARSRRDEERLAGELEAARVVQQILIPEELPHISGFTIETVYKPAGQVGGDFFQVLPCGDDGALIAIGDVSGKGMPAAMTVSLLVGTFRTLADYTESPGEILSAMNQRMVGRQNGGFVTCLVLRITSAGKLNAANAGHLVPYCNGHELAVESGLPLGLNPNTTYPDTDVQLPNDVQLTLLTDGVVEARAKNGELFGFDRSKAISSHSAEQIAKTAQDFGQEDDITVVRITSITASKRANTEPGQVLSPAPA